VASATQRTNIREAFAPLRRGQFAKVFSRKKAARRMSPFTRRRFYIEGMSRVVWRALLGRISVVNFQFCCLASTEFERMNQRNN
jgi:hypothetical protein